MLLRIWSLHGTCPSSTLGALMTFRPRSGLACRNRSLVWDPLHGGGPQTLTLKTVAYNNPKEVFPLEFPSYPLRREPYCSKCSMASSSKSWWVWPNPLGPRDPFSLNLSYVAVKWENVQIHMMLHCEFAVFLNTTQCPFGPKKIIVHPI